MPRAVRFDKYGGFEVLHVVEVDRPTPGPGKVLVRVKATGINPGEASIRKGVFADRWPATFPSGQGSDLAGIVEEVGPGVPNVAVGGDQAPLSSRSIGISIWKVSGDFYETDSDVVIGSDGARRRAWVCPAQGDHRKCS